LAELQHQQVVRALQACVEARQEGFEIPPPVFLAMQGEFVSYDGDRMTLVARFPVQAHQLNPFGTMQGGMIAAAVDNTIGPLSLLVAPASVTRKLEVKYHRATKSDGHICVEARLVERKKRRLWLEALVTDPQGIKLASAQSIHWVIGDVDDA
jgi:uncharacterized protein (TIGR00369 family)